MTVFSQVIKNQQKKVYVELRFLAWLNLYIVLKQGRLPVKWTAYEALLYGTYTTQSDV